MLTYSCVLKEGTRFEVTYADVACVLNSPLPFLHSVLSPRGSEAIGDIKRLTLGRFFYSFSFAAAVSPHCAAPGSRATVQDVRGGSK